MLRLLLSIAFVAVVAEKVSYKNYKVFRINPTSEKDVELLSHLNDESSYQYWQEPSSPFKAAVLMVAPNDLAKFKEFMNVSDIRYETSIENVQDLIDSENTDVLGSERTFNWTTYQTLEEIYSWLASLENTYPKNVEVVVGGKTYEGREIKGVKLSYGQNKSGIFIEGGIHANEWISPATVTYILNQLLTSREPEVRWLAESYDWYIFPSFNPDGYVYTHTMNRMWRKTRAKTQNPSCYGVDPNRNWDFRWNTGGSSSDPCNSHYAGTSPFSEIETRTLSNYIESIADKLFAFISFHSFGQLLLISYGYTTQHLDNYDESYDIGTKTIEVLSHRYGTKYKVGNIPEVLWIDTGSSMDYMKATYKLPIVYTFELRDEGKFGMLLPASEIIPTGQEIVDCLPTLFKEAREFGYPKKNKSS